MTNSTLVEETPYTMSNVISRRDELIKKKMKERSARIEGFTDKAIQALDQNIQSSSSLETSYTITQKQIGCLTSDMISVQSNMIKRRDKLNINSPKISLTADRLAINVVFEQ